mgnify:CR=1 FL=1
MKRSFLFLCLFVFCFLVFPLAAQEAEYIITETELIRLEKISESWETSRRNQQLQVQSLKTRLNEALTRSETLKSQLQTERETLRNLRQSYAEYEKELDIKIQKYEELIDKLNTKVYRLKLVLLIACCISAFLILGSIVFFILKMKLKLL